MCWTAYCGTSRPPSDGAEGPGPAVGCVNAGVLSAERFRALRALWPQVPAELAAWSGTVIADLGRLQPGNPATPLAQSSTAVLLLTNANLEGLFHVRDCVAELSGLTGDPGRHRPSLGGGVKAARAAPLAVPL